MISMKAKYGLQALLYLAKQPNQVPVLISDLAEKENIPKKFLELILLDLKNHGILSSKKGKGGGYSLRRKPEAIKLGRVIRVLDGPLAPVPCVSQTAYGPCDECEDEHTCGIRIVMKEVRDSMASILDNTSLADVIGKVENASARQLDASKYLTYHI
jgi:Rrf2 family protein